VSSTSTNKQPLLVDRPLSDTVRVTTQTVGQESTNTLFVQGGQAPALLVDMDAATSDDNNNGGIVDAIQITRDDFYRGNDYVLSATTSGSGISLVSGQIIYAQDCQQSAVTAVKNGGDNYYKYKGSSAVTGLISALDFTNTATTTGYEDLGLVHGKQPEVTFVFYQTRGTTTPIPASGDYKVLFAKTVPAESGTIDCSDLMPQVAVPTVSAGNTTGLGNASPLRNKGIYLERGDRIYVGVYAEGPNTAGYAKGAHIVAQGGFF
tara:strand:- start:2229 stop:3017 length:789 start_codon:yes stop_codon:yes gene_type:complete